MYTNNGTMSLLAWIESLFTDPAASAAFTADPQRYAEAHGFPNLSSADVHDALCLAADNEPAGYDHYDYNRYDHNRYEHNRYSDERGRYGNDRDGHEGHNSDYHDVHLPPPPVHYSHGHDGHGASYLANYVTNNYTSVNEHNTTIDNSVHERVDTHGGDFTQNIHNDPVIASGQGSIAAGHDIRDSTLATGDRNIVGDHNQAVTGSADSTAFGSGSATDAHLDHTSFGDGAGLSFGGDAAGHNTHENTTTDVRNSGDGSTSVNVAGSHADASQSADQHQADNSLHSAYDDHSQLDSHNDYNSHNDTHYDDSHNLDLQHH